MKQLEGSLLYTFYRLREGTSCARGSGRSASAEMRPHRGEELALIHARHIQASRIRMVTRLRSPSIAHKPIARLLDRLAEQGYVREHMCLRTRSQHGIADPCVETEGASLPHTHTHALRVHVVYTWASPIKGLFLFRFRAQVFTTWARGPFQGHTWHRVRGPPCRRGQNVDSYKVLASPQPFCPKHTLFRTLNTKP